MFSRGGRNPRCFVTNNLVRKFRRRVVTLPFGYLSLTTLDGEGDGRRLEEAGVSLLSVRIFEGLHAAFS